MFLDDDEWFDDVSEIVEFFCSGEYLQYQSATYQIRNYTNLEGAEYNMAILGRMVRRKPETCFIGSIHEAFSELQLPCKDFSAYVHHYGYAYSGEEEKIAHIQRNVTLIEKELQKNPGDLRYRTQMAMELGTFDNEGALRFCEETFQKYGEEKDSIYIQWMLALVFRLFESLGASLETAEHTYVELKQSFGFSETTENAISYQMVRLCLLNNCPEKAYPYAKKYFTTLQFLKENERERQLQMAADSFRYQTEEAYLEMLHFGAYGAWRAGAYADAWDWYQKMPWEEETFQNEEAFQLMLGLFQEQGNVRALLDILKRVMKNQSLMQIAAVRKSISDVLAMLK